MTLTHLSHFGLEIISDTDSSVVLSGTLADCKRIAAAHGMEVERYEGRLVSLDCGHVVRAPVDQSRPVTILYKGGGLVMQGRDDYSIVIPRRVWNELV